MEKKKVQETPEQFSQVMGMGSPVDIFHAKVSIVLSGFLTAVLMLGAGGALLYAGSILWEKWGRYYPPVIFQDMLPWVAGGGIAFGIGVLVLVRMIRNRRKAAVIYTNGFAYSDQKGVQTWRWEQVQDVTANVVRHYTNGIYTGTTHTYTLQKSTGEQLVLNDSLKNIESFFTHLQNNTLQHRYQRLADSYNLGDLVSFGPVTIGKKIGVQVGKKSYPWEEIEEVTIQKGTLSIKKKNGGWFSGASVSAGSIPNLQILLSIINQIVGLKAGQ